MIYNIYVNFIIQWNLGYAVSNETNRKFRITEVV